ncbi:MAG: nitrous oxide reductase accessory protein NosL [Flavobacteriaceae bacterium]|nr:nitrous oxide reductase accessory protein NosL [Flavobacteriaceae bacterium]
MKNHYLAVFGVILLLSISCKVEPEKINFGQEACHFCKMTIVDQQHASQYITKKGKQYKFDSIECMLNSLDDITTENISVFLVSDYGNPGNMTDVITATYLISEEIKSPMGAFLSAFSSDSLANETLQKSGGKLYTWSTIKEKYHVE